MRDSGRDASPAVVTLRSELWSVENIRRLPFYHLSRVGSSRGLVYHRTEPFGLVGSFSPQRALQFRKDSGLISGVLEAVLPDTEHRPTEREEFPGATSVALPSREALLFPVTPIVVGQLVAARTSMPETSVHEDRHLLSSKNEVRFAWKSWVPTPPGKAGRSQQADDGALSGLVAFRTNTRHVMRALSRGKPVCHFNSSFLIWPDLLESLFQPSQQV
jgi:hypothetical protein